MSQSTTIPNDSNGLVADDPKRNADQNAASRKSFSDSCQRLSAPARRALLKRLLPGRESGSANGTAKPLNGDELALLRQLALEEATGNPLSVIRYRAILQLAHYPTVENLNLLEELCRRGENAYVRSHALLALGNCGVRLAGAVLREGLAADSLLEKTAAAKALDALARAAGADAQEIAADRRGDVVRQLRDIATELTLDPPEPCPAICQAFC